jgi:hypothetical protein
MSTVVFLANIKDSRSCLIRYLRRVIITRFAYGGLLGEKRAGGPARSSSMSDNNDVVLSKDE